MHAPLSCSGLSLVTSQEATVTFGKSTSVISLKRLFMPYFFLEHMQFLYFSTVMAQSGHIMAQNAQPMQLPISSTAAG